MSYKRVVARNGIGGDYTQAGQEPPPHGKGAIAGDLRRLEADQRDPDHLLAYARIAGVSVEQARLVLDALFEGQASDLGIAGPEQRSSRFAGVTDPAVLTAEREIIWLGEQGADLYLREKLWQEWGEQEPDRHLATHPKQRLVAYARLQPGSGRADGLVARRVWVVNSYDPYPQGRGWPVEAVWFWSVRAGLLSAGPNDDMHRHSLGLS